MEKLFLIFALFFFTPLLSMDRKQTRPRSASLDSPQSRKKDVMDRADKNKKAFLSWSKEDNTEEEDIYSPATKTLPDVKTLTPREYMHLRAWLESQ